VRPAKGQGLALKPPAGFHLASIVKSDKIYLVPWLGDSHNEILVGSTTEPEAGFDDRTTDAARQFLFEGAIALFPALREAEVLRHWSGLRPQNSAKRHPPIMGRHPKIANLWISTAHFKTGIGLAPIASDLLATAILTGEVPSELAPFAPRIP
jgi:glycine oxidase